MKSWTEDEKRYVMKNIGKLSFETMAKNIGKTKNAVHLFIHRQRISYKQTVKVNLLTELLDIAFIKAEYFNPTKEFYTEIKMTQMRFWSLYRGEASPTEIEYKRLRKHFGIKKEIIFNNRQLNLFDDKKLI